MSQRDRSAARGSVGYALAGMVDRAAFFVAIPIITHHVPVETFAWLTLARVSLPVAHNLTDLGASAGTVRFASREGADRAEIFATLLASRLIGVTLLGGLAVGGGALLWPAALAPLAWAVLAYAGVSLSEALGARLRAVGRHARVAWSYTAGGLLELAIVGGLALAESMTLTTLLVALAARFACTAALLAPPALRDLARPRASRWLGLVRFGAPVAGNYLVAALGAFDRWLVEPLTSLASVGAYQLGSVTGSVVELVERALFWAFEPRVYGDPAEETRPIETLLRVYGIACALFVFPAVFLMPELLAILAPPSYAAAIALAPWLAAAAAAQGLFRIVGLASGVARRTRPWALAGAVELAATVGLFALALPAFGILAAGPARLIAAALGTLVGYWASRRVSSFRGPVVRVLALLVAGASIGAATLSEVTGGVRPGWLRALAALGFAALTLAVLRVGRAEAARWARALRGGRARG